MSNPNTQIDDFDTQVQCEEMYDDTLLDDLTQDPDFDDYIDVPCDVVGSDDDDISDLFEEDGGLTAGAFEMLAKWDANGELV